MRKKLRTWAASLLLAGVMTLATGAGLLQNADLAVSDLWYQTRSASDGHIILIGIDEKSLEEQGPYSQWRRNIIAGILDKLNAADDCHPAVIGVDILYTGKSNIEEDDALLAQNAAKYGNVVTACAAKFGTGLLRGADDEYYLDTASVLDFETPYRMLEESTEQGHINAMLDADGILRHHLLKIRLDDGHEIPSMALMAAEKYSSETSGNNDGPLSLPPVNSRGFWYLPFSCAPGDFECISAADVLSGKVGPDIFKNKIVLIGPYAAGLQDSYFTSIDHSRPMYGIEFQANAVQALLWGDYKIEAAGSVQLLLLFLVLILAFVGFWKRKVWSSTALWLFLCGGYLLLCRFLYSKGLVLHVLWIPACTTVLYIACIAFNYIQAAAGRRKVTNTFKRYVAPEIVNELLQDKSDVLNLGGRQVRIAVLFVDVRGFTSMSEKLEPAQVVDILNQYLTLISQCILDNGGTLDKFIGDAAMAFCVAPLTQEDYVMKAAKAAVDMVNGSRRLSEELHNQYGHAISFGIGIHVGEAVVGNIGSPKRMDYTAIGDTVNTASRRESNAPAGTIYISRAVADALEGRIRTAPLDAPIKLKGKKDGFEILTLEEIL